MREAVIPPPMSAYEIHLESQVGLNFYFFVSLMSVHLYMSLQMPNIFIMQVLLPFFLAWFIECYVTFLVKSVLAIAGFPTFEIIDFDHPTQTRL